MNIDELLQGSIDMHVHFAPDALMEFRMDAVDTAKSAHQMGMKAIVLKAHTYITAPLASLAEKMVSITFLSNCHTRPIRTTGIYPTSTYLQFVIKGSFRYRDNSLAVMIWATGASS